MKDQYKRHYDNLAKEYGGFQKFKHIDEFPDGQDPEDIFEDWIKKYGGDNKTGLDIGCGDGKKTIEFAPYYKKIFGVDYSEEMIKIAKQKYAKENVEYVFGDINNLPIESNSIDVAWSRRGPTLEKEIRILKNQSVYIQIKIAYQDCLELKKLFGRGQDFEKSNIDDIEELKNIYQKSGFKILLAQRYKYVSFYPKEDFISFLQNTPVLVDFDLEKDQELFEKYIQKVTSQKGIQLNREKIIFVAER